MNWLISAYEYIVQACGTWGVLLLVLLLILFFVQLRYWVWLYGRIPAYRDSTRTSDSEARPAVSVILVFHQSDFDYIENVLPVILSQEYDDFEVVVTDISGDADFSDALGLIAEHNPRFVVTTMVNNVRFPISDKMALNVAIKSSRFENIIMTTPDSRPVSEQWIARMARGFTGADIIIGYCGMEQGKGFANKMIRTARVGHSMRWLCAAMRGKAYSGTIHNIGFTKKLYFDNGGFNHLNLNIGVDDLFVQKMIVNAQAAVVVSSNSIVRQRLWGGLGLWYAVRKLYSNAFRYYPPRVKRYVGTELWSRFLFFAVTVAAMVVLPLEFKLFAAGVFVLRLLMVIFEMRRISIRLSERGILSVVIIYDIVSPFYEAYMAIERRLRRSPGLWR